MPTYVTLKDVKKRWGNGQEDIFPVLQWEKLWGDMTTLPEANTLFLAVPPPARQHSRSRPQLDSWLRDGSAAHIESLAAPGNSLAQEARPAATRRAQHVCTASVPESTESCSDRDKISCYRQVPPLWAACDAQHTFLFRSGQKSVLCPSRTAVCKDTLELRPASHTP
jgi:hypothetical protein